jgi:hypothetical protein
MGSMAAFAGALAQLVERYDGIVEVSGSTPLRSISLRFLVKFSHLFKDARALIKERFARRQTL